MESRVPCDSKTTSEAVSMRVRNRVGPDGTVMPIDIQSSYRISDYWVINSCDQCKTRAWRWKCINSWLTLPITLPQSPISDWRNSHAVGYHTLSSRSSIQ